MKTTFFSLLLILFCTYAGYSQKFTGIIIDSKGDTIHAEFKKPYKLKDGKGILFRTPFFERFNELYPSGYEKVIINGHGEYHNVQLPGMREPKWGRLMVAKEDVILYQHAGKIYRKTPNGLEEVGVGNQVFYYDDTVQKILKDKKSLGAIGRRLDVFYSEQGKTYQKYFPSRWEGLNHSLGAGIYSQELNINYKGLNVAHTMLVGPMLKYVGSVFIPHIGTGFKLYGGLDVVVLNSENKFHTTDGDLRYSYELDFKVAQLSVPVSVRFNILNTPDFILMCEFGTYAGMLFDSNNTVMVEYLKDKVVRSEFADLELRENVEVGTLAGLQTVFTLWGNEIKLGGQMRFHSVDDSGYNDEITSYFGQTSINVSLLISL